MRALVAVLLLTSVAHADKITRAVKKAGFRKPEVIARGKVWLVDAVARDGSGHGLLVQPARGKVLDAGAPFEDGTVAVAPFFSHDRLWDVTLTLRDGEQWHYVVRAHRFELACQFAGSSSTGAPMTITETADAPLTWTMTAPPPTGDLALAGQLSGADRRITFQLGTTGACREVDP